MDERRKSGHEFFHAETAGGAPQGAERNRKQGAEGEPCRGGAGRAAGKDDYGNLAYTKVEFGYLFQVEGRGTEALFKVTTDKTTVYFAVQGARLMRLNFSEELFQTTVDSFLELHG